MSIFRAPGASEANGSMLAGAFPLWQGPPARSEAAVLACPSGSLSRRSSVVEHVIGNDGVSSSILLGGTIYGIIFRSLDTKLKGPPKVP